MCTSAVPRTVCVRDGSVDTRVDSASDDLVDPNQIRSLLKDLREARQSKSRLGLENLREGVQAGYFEVITPLRATFIK